MDFWQANIQVIKKFAVFKGRATRSEYWYFTLSYCILMSCVGILDKAIFKLSPLEGLSPLYSIFYLLTLTPYISLSFRRLHDINKSGWWLLLTITVIGLIPLIFWTCLRSDGVENRFGPSPIPDQNFKRKKFGIIPKILLIISIIILISSIIIFIIILIISINRSKVTNQLFIPELQKLSIIKHYVGNINTIDNLYLFLPTNTDGFDKFTNL